tara:strand:- start:579 stop:857 length:279 start_codon:yes stop_codon:yes gene_type:complete
MPSTNVLKLVRLTREEFNSLSEGFADRVVENMDVKTLERIVYDMICDSHGNMSDNQLLEEVYDYEGCDDRDFADFCSGYGVSDHNIEAFLDS